MRKKGLPILAGLLGVAAAAINYGSFQIRTTRTEKNFELDGDDLIPHPIGVVNHAITNHNGGHRSADRILPEYQRITVGDVMPAVPGAEDVFVVAHREPERSLVLAWKLPDGRYQTTWAFALTQPAPGQTRLIVRGRVAPGYRPYGLPQWIALSIGRPAHFAMEQKQLPGLARRAEYSRWLL
jgi:hypothetical protein